MNPVPQKIKSYVQVILIIVIAWSTITAADSNLNKFFVLNPTEQYLIRIFNQNGTTNIRLFETKEMNQISQWQITDFSPHTVRFSDTNPNQLILASQNKIITYNIGGGKEQKTYEHEVTNGETITQISFDRESNDIIWATDYTVYKTNPKENKTTKIGLVDKSKGPINSLSILKGHKIAVSQKKSLDIHVFSPGYQKVGKKVSEHKAPVVGIQSPKGQTIYSVDKQHNILIWDIFTRQIINQAKLPQPDIDSEIIATGLDDQNENLLILHQIGKDIYGEKYRLNDLKNGIISPKKHAISGNKSGQLHSTNALLSSDYSPVDAITEEIKKQKPIFILPDPPKQKPTPLQLATIEAQSENYYKALDFIKQVSADDPEYRQSRILQKEIYDKIDAQNKINAAKEQYASHSYQSAKILLNEALEKDSKNKQAKKYLNLVEKQLSRSFWNKIYIAAIIIAILGIGGFIIYKFLFAAEKENQSEKETFDEYNLHNGNISEIKLLRQEFITTRNQTREILKRAILMDKMGKYKIKWIEFSTQIKIIEKKAKLSEKKLPELIEELKTLQTSVKNISWHKFKRAQRHTKYTGPKNKDQQQSQKKTANNNQQGDATEELNYYEILGVSKNATTEEIKKAFRIRMKEYHPDKHNASDFKWIKEEASRMTKLIQEAYQTLSDPAKRKTYTP
jgi:hypothetical protein